jgi:hypothetical protein
MKPVEWIEFQLVGPIETHRYRTTPDARTVQWFAAQRVPGMARQGWNTTTSATVQMRARKAIKAAKG